MDPDNMAGAGMWRINEGCWAPSSDKGELKEGVVESIEHKEDNGDSYAMVRFLDATERRVPISQLCKTNGSGSSWKSLFDDEDLEKPYFPDRRPSAPASNLQLSDTGISVPYTINRHLRDYQRDGVRFLYGHYSRSSGCILGDDMGLGKTIQVIAFLAAVLKKKGTREDIENNMPEFLLRTMKKSPAQSAKKVFLIVSPLSVLFNWRDELETWGYFKVVVIHGSQKDYELGRLKQGKYEIALTTYETLRLCLDDINSIQWSAVIVDEAHRIKNPKARVTQVMKSLRCKVRIGLTGTILQNNMDELWCVMDWALPGFLGRRKQFKEEFSKPVELGQRHNATKRELATGRKVMQKLAIKMSLVFLRRTKNLISDQLPKKEDRVVFCALSEFQKAVYQTVLETEDVSLVLRGNEKCSCRSGRRRRNCCYSKNQHDESLKTIYFSYLAILRKVANHAALLQSDTNTSKKQEAHIKRICSEVFSKFPEFVQKTKDAAFETISDPKYSGKMKVLQQLLNHCRKNKDKVLLFSFSTKLLDILERYLMASGLEYRRLDGSTKAEDRVKIVKEFNIVPDVNICLVSTMAGGLGLNFVGANVVVVFDPTWNPANDLQAVDRAYRIGQCRDVKVLRLISLGTVEEIIYLRQVYKQQLQCVAVGSENAKRYFKAVQGSREHKGELFGIHNLFKLRIQGTCLTKDILEREGQVEAGIRSTMYINQEPISSDTNKDEMETDETTNAKLDDHFQKEAFDFSSDSDDAGNSGSIKKSKVPAHLDSKQASLLHCGFSRLLEKGQKNQSRNGDLSALSSSEMKRGHDSTECLLKKDSKIVKRNGESSHIGLDISFDSDEDPEPRVTHKHHTPGKGLAVPDTDSSSDEGDNIVWPTQANARGSSIKSARGTRTTAESDEASSSEYDTPAKKTRKPTDGSSDYISDESDDITIPNLSKQKMLARSKKCNTEKNSQTIEEFSTSEDDDYDDKKMRVFKEMPLKSKGKIQFKSKTNIPERRFSSDILQRYSADNKEDGVSKHKREHVGTLDQILDGVAEVAYIHSNQNVVGSSKAENHMSHWAVKHVFELQQFSQLPANIAPQLMENLQSPKKEKESVDVKEKVLKYPVIHSEKEVLSIGEKIFRVGETPKPMIKRHFEQMVSYFEMDSAENFARHIVNSESHIRQSLLQEFYRSQHPEAEHLYLVEVSKLKEENDSSPKTKYTKITMKKRHKSHMFVKGIETNCGISNHGEIMEIGESSYVAHLNKESISPPEREVKKPQDNVQEAGGFSCRVLKTAEPQTSSTIENGVALINNSRKPKSVNNVTNPVSDLLGDTSILDDLFSNPSTRRPASLPVKPQCELATARTERGSKDFWDILCEESDESINRLTDLSVIEKVCETSILPSVPKRHNWDNSMWVNNKRFLWRKDTKNTDSESPGKSSDL